MSHNFPLDASFFKLLMLIDTELAKEQKTQGCPYCGGLLHRADYPRSPFGIPAAYRDFFTQHIS